MILSPEVLTLYILNALLALFATIAFYLSAKIAIFYNKESTTPLQYTLEKSSYLSATIIQYMLMLKIALFLFFIFTLDKLSNVIQGAMCAAGIVDATEYGSYLLLLKLLNLYLFGYWIVLHKEDVKYEQQPYVRLKFTLFTLFYFLLISEIVLEVFMFSSMDSSTLVDCCGAIYSNSSGTYIAWLVNREPTVLLSFFYGLFFVMLVAYKARQEVLFSLVNLFFAIISIITLISFFGTYIYELPTHKCPFCFLQQDYNYVGYLLYSLLFIGTFYGVVLSLIKFFKDVRESYFRISMAFNSMYTLIVSYYPVAYFVKNGVWLS